MIGLSTYNAQGLGAVIYPFLQQNVLNYRDFMLAKFKKDLADSMTWQLLPLGATAPADAVQFMKVDRNAAMVAEVEEFISELRRLMDHAQAAGGDMGRVAAIYDIHMQSQKQFTSADLIVSVSQTADGRISLQKTDPNQTHPFSATELLKRVNKKRGGRQLTTYDHQAICWKESLRENKKYAWKHSNGASHVWSGDALSYLASLSDNQYDEIRAQYREYLRAQSPRTASPNRASRGS